MNDETRAALRAARAREAERRIRWYTERVVIARRVLLEELPDAEWSEEHLTTAAVAIVCADGISDSVDGLIDAVNSIDVSNRGGS